VSLLRSLFGGRPKAIPIHLASLAAFNQHVMQSDLPVIVDVWSATCAPCRQLEPVLIEVATKYQGRVRVAELSTSAEPRLLAQLAVQATPTILVFHRGKELGRMAGFRPLSWFDAMIAAEFPEA
jgi:thioredoxin-like negative regulator of GroEL